MPELLSAAPNAEAVVAAVQAGADAIYIRFTGSGARGFTEAGLQSAVRYCRVRGCRVYAELDTFISDGEIGAAAELVRSLCRMGVHAVIAQDLGFISVARQAAPDMSVFAGDRLGIRTLSGVDAMRALGVKRVFLPRELSFEELATLAAHSQLEFAVALQSEQCIAVAGQCALSALNGRSSANRGECSGICREQYSLGGRMDDHPLSLMDIRCAEYLQRLNAIGISSVYLGRGIERPEQYARILSILRRCLAERRDVSENEIDGLNEVFGTRRFTPGYIAKASLGDMHGDRGSLNREAERAMSAVRRNYAKSEVRRVHVEFYAIIQRNRAVRLAVQDTDGNRALWSGPAPLPAQQGSISAAEVDSFLHKTGRTPYICDRVNLLVDEGLALPQGVMQEGKRAIIRELTEKRSKGESRKTARVPAVKSTALRRAKPALIFETLMPSQLTEDLAALKPDYLYVPLEIIAKQSELLEPFIVRNTRIAVVLPRIISDSELGATAKLLKAAQEVGVTEVLCSNLGDVALVSMAGMAARGDFGLNLYNSYALEIAALAGLRSATASFELSLELIEKLKKPLDVEIIAYGRLPAMLTEHCIIKESAGRCVCSAPARLTDERGGAMPILREGGCRNAIYSSSKVFLPDKAEELGENGIWGMRLLFTNESPRECVEVAKSFLGENSYRPNGATRALYMKGV